MPAPSRRQAHLPRRRPPGRLRRTGTLHPLIRQLHPRRASTTARQPTTPGLSLNATTGALSGTPTTTGANTFTIAAGNNQHPERHSRDLDSPGHRHPDHNHQQLQVYAVGNDWTASIPRALGPNQTLIAQSTDARGDTYWVQSLNAPTPIAGTTVTIDDTAPTTDEWNLAPIEID